jgi:hypothetical protein
MLASSMVVHFTAFAAVPGDEHGVTWGASGFGGDNNAVQKHLNG